MSRRVAINRQFDLPVMRLTVTAACLLVLLGCAPLPPATTVRITVLADADANERNATALDLVFVYDAHSDAALPASAPEWFARRAELQSELASSLSVIHLELPPESGTPVSLNATHAKAVGVYSYANYIGAAGQTRGRLTPYAHVTVRLMRDQVVYSND